MKRLLVLLLFSVLINSACQKIARRGYSIVVKNNSQQTINIYASYIYPDTLLSVTKPNLKSSLPDKFIEIHDSEVNDPKFERLHKEKISIFVLSKDTVDAYSWEIIKSDYNILKRYDLNIEQLRANNWTITYP